MKRIRRNAVKKRKGAKTMQPSNMVERLRAGGLEERFSYIYVTDAAGAKNQAARYEQAVNEFAALFGEQREVALYSAPGRTEVGGNHTDHQHGRVLAASVNLDVIAVCARNEENIIRIQSEGYQMDTIDLTVLEAQPAEYNHAASLIRGVAARFRELGYEIGGLDAYTTSNVLKGSGLSSSAAFEVLVGTMLSHCYNSGRVSAIEIAQIGQYAENVFFGKPCGLMDQMASSVGGFVAIDFKDPQKPVVERVEFDFADSGYALCIVDTGGNHADLTPDYASIPAEMRCVAAMFGKELLRDVNPEKFYSAIADVREKTGDRAVLRAIHFFADSQRAGDEADALREGDFARFQQLVLESGQSSFQYLQNVYSIQSPAEQGLSLGLALSQRVLKGRGAWRVHGGGFAGTIQAFVPLDLLEPYRATLEAAFGVGKCYMLSIRPVGGIRVDE